MIDLNKTKNDSNLKEFIRQREQKMGDLLHSLKIKDDVKIKRIKNTL